MKLAYAYARVSTKEQEEMKNSIPEQLNRIKKFAESQGIEIVKEKYDSDSAFHDENRVQLENMIELAIKERPYALIFDDSSRLARTKERAITIKKTLRSHGIKVLYASEPNIDDSTPTGFWVEGIQEIKNEATSREISYHTKKGMTGNIAQRDTETGWCYKNGGKAPYGYKRKILYRGENRKGKPIYKTIWEIDEDTYKIVRMIIVDMYINKEMSYTSIRDYLNNNNIKNSNGGVWSTSTISSMLTKDRLEEYTGTAIWNKQNHKIIGIKYNDREEWIICENAHPAIITKEELTKALKRKEKTSSTTYTYRPTSEYLLTGKNIEDEFMFICAECGGHVIGSSTGKNRNKSYCCANNRHKGKCGCKNNFKVDKDWLEDKILQIIEENYICDEGIQKYVDIVYNKINNGRDEYSIYIKKKQTEINKINQQIQNLLNGIKNGLNGEIAIQEINNLKIELDKNKEQLEEIKESCNNTKKVTREDIEKYFINIRDVFYNSQINEKKELLQTFIYSISLSQHQIEIFPYLRWCLLMEQVTGIEPV